MTVIETTERVRQRKYDWETAYVHDFDDGYHDIREKTELEIRVQNELRTKYKYFSDYKRAIVLYDEYMESLHDKYGGKKFFKLMLKHNQIPEYIPSKPIFVSNGKNKFIIENNIILSKGNSKKIPINDIDDYIEQTYYENAVATHKDNTIVCKVKETKIKLKFKSKSKKKKDKNRKFESKIEKYLKNDFSSKNKKKKDKAPKELSLLDILTENKKYKKYTKYYNEPIDNDAVANIGGIMVPAKDVEFHTTIRELSKYGWDSEKLLKDKLGKNNSLFKVIKRNKKRNKKKSIDRKKVDKKRESFLDSVISYGGYNSFEDFKKDYLDLTSSNVLNLVEGDY